jgi:4-amino-4-deoxy-L-arabinose transferase-like glycosyltransferase
MTARRKRLGLLAILGLALAVRLLHFAAVRTDPFVAHPILDSQEYDRWARAILAGSAPAEAFFQPPLYPYFIAGLYALSAATPAAVYLAQILLALAGCWALFRAGERLAGERVGIAAAALFATYPLFVLHDVQLLKESLAVTLSATMLWALIEGCANGRPALWAAAGLAAGTLCLLRENTLLVLPLLASLAWKPAAPAAARLRRIAAFLLAASLPLLPVAWRNARAGGGFLPTTFQGGVNFYIGNHAGADGTYQPLVPGKQIPAYERGESVRLAEQAVGRKLRPSEVSRYWLSRSLGWARAQPAAFIRLQLRKLRLFWSWYEWPDAVDPYYLRSVSPILRLPWLDFGGVTILALAGLWMGRRRLGELAPVLIWIAGSMLATTIFFLFSRYRLPTVPALMLLAALPLAALADAMGARDRRREIALAALVVAALVLPRLPGYQPRWDLVHFNLGRVHQEAGDAAAAEREYRLALQENPRDFLSCLNLGTMAARSGDYADAQQWFEKAVEIEPASDDAEANLGGALLATGERGAARIHLERALQLNPSNAFALHNLGILERGRE